MSASDFTVFVLFRGKELTLKRGLSLDEARAFVEAVQAARHHVRDDLIIRDASTGHRVASAATHLSDASAVRDTFVGTLGALASAQRELRRVALAALALAAGVPMASAAQP